MGPIGVLCLQGDFREHLLVLDAIGANSVKVRKPADLVGIAGLIIPGGESTVIDKLSETFKLRDPIIQLLKEGLPVFGTCAGLILLSDRVADGTPSQKTFGGLEVLVQRNAFGSQLNSFESDIVFKGIGDTVRGAFIRAPIVLETGNSVEVLARIPDGRIVAVQQGNVLGISFHPEVTGELAVHEYFLKLCKEAGFGSTN